MIIHYFSLLNVIDKIHIDSYTIIENIRDYEDPDARDFNASIKMLNEYSSSNITRAPLLIICQSTGLFRHLGFAEYYSEKGNDVDYIISNLNDVISIDIPKIKLKLLNYFNQNIDAELFKTTENLLINNEVISAVRSAFTLLSSRIRKALDISSNVNDGLGLIDTAFSKKHTILFRSGKVLEEKDKEYFKSILKGYYYFVRNNVAHETDIEQVSADAALATINYVLLTLKL
jgi:hypothetical protein